MPSDATLPMFDYCFRDYSAIFTQVAHWCGDAEKWAQSSL